MNILLIKCVVLIAMENYTYYFSKFLRITSKVILLIDSQNHSSPPISRLTKISGKPFKTYDDCCTIIMAFKIDRKRKGSKVISTMYIYTLYIVLIAKNKEVGQISTIVSCKILVI